MKKFDIIDERDARTLERGETVLLGPGGIVTPLALDTLRDRAVTVIRQDAASEAELLLAPVAEIRRVAVASDATGTSLRRDLVGFLRGQGLAVEEIGADRQDTLEYPDAAAAAAALIVCRAADAAIVVDGSGIGSAIAANKVNGIRAAMATSTTMARYAREHNGTNVLTLGATLIDAEEARAIVRAWLTTSMREPRYIRRLSKIHDLERRQPRS